MSISSYKARLTLLAVLSATTLYCFYKSRRLKTPTKTSKLSQRKNKIFCVSQTGTSKTLAHKLNKVLSSHGFQFDVVDPINYEPEDLVKENLILIVASTWEDGNPPQNGRFLVNWVAESADDFRVGKLALSNCKFAVFGVGSRGYGKKFNAVGKGLVKGFRELGGKELLPLWKGDVDGGELDRAFEAWGRKVVEVLKEEGCGGVVRNGINGVVNGEGSDSDGDSGDCYSEDEEEEEERGESGVVDLEDIAGKGPSRRKSGGVVESNGKVNGKKDMVTPVIRANLEKQVC